MNADEMREIAGMLYDILDNNSTTMSELQGAISRMADSLEQDADDMEDGDDDR